MTTVKLNGGGGNFTALQWGCAAEFWGWRP